MGQVCMPVEEAVYAAHRWQALLIIYMSVGEEQAFPLVYNQGVVGKYGELEEHLVYFGVAVASDGDNAVFQGIQPPGDGLRVEVGGHAVARAVVEQVSQQHEHIELVGLKMAEYAVECTDGAVYVGGDEILHDVDVYERR